MADRGSAAQHLIAAVLAVDLYELLLQGVACTGMLLSPGFDGRGRLP
ncbi:hypothetical protein ACFYPT_38615 [Streptomyces sp. NPDC005529]